MIWGLGKGFERMKVKCVLERGGGGGGGKGLSNTYENLANLLIEIESWEGGCLWLVEKRSFCF